jgi:hypothetical protein
MSTRKAASVRKPSKAIAVFALPDSKEVRLWSEKRTSLLSPSQARGIAFSLMVAADRAEGRRIPNDSKEKHHG